MRGEQLLILPTDRHPFATEFYLQSLEDPSGLSEAARAHRQHSFIRWNPVTSAASSLSKLVGSWRHALARMVPVP
jgi:hypothetical protein